MNSESKKPAQEIIEIFVDIGIFDHIVTNDSLVPIDRQIKEDENSLSSLISQVLSYKIHIHKLYRDRVLISY